VKRRTNPWIVLALLTLVYTIGFLDRQILNLLVEPIKSDFALSDVQVSLLQGLAFSAPYILFSPVFGRLVDVAPRRNILIGAMIVWSCFTAIAGFTRGFWGLFAARGGVGAAEAGLTPAAWSLLSDVFDSKRLPFAFSIFLMGPYLGGGLALLAGGLILRWVETTGYRSVSMLSAMAPWQATFLIVSIPGLLCAILLLFMREPARTGTLPADTETMKLGEVGRVIVKRRGFYGYFYLGMAFNFIPLYAFPAWMPAYAMRRFDQTISTVGVDYGLITLASGIVGVLSGPFLGRFLQRRGYDDAYLRLAVFTACGMLLASIAVYFAQSYAMALAAAGFAGLCYSAPASLAASALQLATPNRMRGITSSIYVLVTTIAGLLLAPTLVAVLTDYLFKDDARVGESLALVCGASSILTAIMMWRCLPAYRRLLGEAD
jgi:MFS family permease